MHRDGTPTLSWDRSSTVALERGDTLCSRRPRHQSGLSISTGCSAAKKDIKGFDLAAVLSGNQFTKPFDTWEIFI
jgi:hypothetical protein